MRKSVLAALMAASVLVPVAANAQDEEGPRGRGLNQGSPPERRSAPQQQQQQQREPRGDFGGRGGFGGGARGDFAGRARPAPQVQAEAQVQVQAQARPDFQRGDRGNRPDRAERGPYQGRQVGGQGGYNTGVVPPQQPPVVQQARPERARGGVYDSGYRGGRDGVAQQGNRAGDDRRAYGNRGDQRNGQLYDRNDRRNDGRGYNGGRGSNGYTGVTGYGNGYGGANANRAWSRDWRRDDRYNYSGYRNQNRNAFRLPRYYAPYGWDYGYRRFSVGFTLSSILFDQDYWIDDPFYYRLPPAYGQYRWVRYYNDALLVDLRTGYVVDTVYDIFW